MINPYNVIELLTNLISNRLTFDERPDNTARDDEVAEILFDNVQSILSSTSYFYENHDTLDLDDDRTTSTTEEIGAEEKSDDDNDDASNDDNRTDDEDYQHIDENDKYFSEVFSLEYMQCVVEYHDEIDPSTGKRKRSFSTVQQRFKRVKDRSYIRRFRMYIEKQGTKRQKLDKIDRFVYESFNNRRKEFLSVHDIDLKRWALSKAHELGDTSFTASDHWAKSFKKRHGIVSRKITKLTTKRNVDSEDTISKTVDDFLNYSNRIISNYSPSRVFNTDQSGLQLEIYSNRTLSYQGEKITVATVRSINNTTHSYTVQPMITMSGNVVGPLFLCLKEESGRLSDRIKKNLFKADNVVLTCSKSGKLNRSLVEYWKDHVLLSVMNNGKYLLLSDSWGTQSVDEIYNDLNNLKRLEIPKKTTAILQPLDVYFNRQYKKIIRTMYDHVRLYDYDVNLAQRNSIIKMNSLAYNQLSSKVFKPMIQYAWFRSGYLINDPGDFKNVKSVCFDFKNYSCDVDRCDESTFIRCSWCQKVLCFSHFFIDYHFH